MRLNEFLEQCIPAYKLRDVLYNNDEFLINYLSEPEHSYGVASFYIDRDSLLEELKNHGMKMTGFDKMIQKYGWYISFIRGNKVSLLKLNGYDEGFYDVAGAHFSNLYLHISNAGPSKIKSNGLIAKDSLDPEIDISGTMKRGILYPNKRVYLWKLEDISGNFTKSAKNFEDRVIATFRSLLRGLNASGYGMYVYLVRLPEGLKTHYDQEYGPENPARYVTQNVPPSYIKYIGTVTRLEEIVLAKDYRRLEQILGI